MKAWNWALAGLGGALLGLWASTAGSAPQEVVTKDGKTYVGEVSEKGAKLTIAPLSGEASVTVNKTDVKERKAFKAETARAELKKKRAALKNEDTAGRMDLGNWAAVRGLLPEALAIYQELAKEGNRLAEVEATRIKDIMASASAPKGGKDMPKGMDPASGGDTKIGAAAAPADEKDIKRIKLREYGEGDSPRFTLVKKDLAKDPKFKDFGSFTADQKDLLAKAREAAAADPAFLESINFAPEPATLVKWHSQRGGVRSIQDILLKNCATKACHGGGEPRFQLLVETPTKEAVAYGNFDYVRRYNGGTLVRPNFPETSPLLMYGLPLAEKKDKVGLDPVIKNHPPVKKMGTGDSDYGVLKEWIAKLAPVNLAPAEQPKEEKPKDEKPAP